MRKILPVLFMTILISCNQKSDPQLIIVEGLSKESILPDNAIINMQIIVENKSHLTTTKLLSEKYNKLIDSLSKIGIQSNRVKTLYLNVSIKEEYINDRSVNTGFTGSQGLELVLNNDYKNISKIVDYIYNLNLDLEMSISYSLTDNKILNLKKKLLKKSIEDATEKAKILASNTDSKLVKINKIRYGNTLNYENLEYGIKYSTLDKYNNNQSKSESGSFKFNAIPKEIEVNESVVVFWEIK